MGLTESSLSTILKPFECANHCKCTAKSPCCKRSCGDEGCICGIDTHEYDAEEEHNNTIDQVSGIYDK